MGYFDLKRPCGNICPFHRECLPGWLGRDRAQEIADSLERSSFPCHKTTQFDEEDEVIRGEEEMHCAGALIVQEKMDRPGQMLRIGERLGLYDHRKLDMEAPIFDDLDEFVDHHS